MPTPTWGSWTVSGIALSLAIACGSSAPPPPPPSTTSGHEEAERPPPPPPPASVRVVHASADPGLGTLSIALDEASPIVTDLAAGSASAAIEVPAGAHSLRVLGVASVETHEAPLVLTTNVELARGSRAILLVVGEPAAEPPLTVSVLDEDASGTSTRARIVHGLIGVAAIDVCVAGAAIAPALASGAISPVTPIVEGATALELHAASGTACHGRSLGIAHATLSAGTSYVIALSGQLGRRGRLAGSFVVCSEGSSGACENVALVAR